MYRNSHTPFRTGDLAGMSVGFIGSSWSISSFTSVLLQVSRPRPYSKQYVAASIMVHARRPTDQITAVQITQIIFTCVSAPYLQMSRGLIYKI